MATAGSAHFELQKSSSETYGWCHGQCHPLHPCARHWILNCIRSPKFAVCKLLQTVLVHNFKNIYLLFYLHWKCKCFILFYFCRTKYLQSESGCVERGTKFAFQHHHHGSPNVSPLVVWSRHQQKGLSCHLRGWVSKYVSPIGNSFQFYVCLSWPFVCPAHDMFVQVCVHLSKCLCPNVCVFVCNFGVRKCRSCLKTI